MTIRILSARVEHAHYDRDFGQVEALVSFLVKDDKRPVPHRIRVRTCDDARGGKPLRQRLVASAREILDRRPPVATHLGLQRAA